jgi:hypothetical protein
MEKEHGCYRACIHEDRCKSLLKFEKVRLRLRWRCFCLERELDNGVGIDTCERA